VAASLCPIPFWPGPKIKNCNEGSRLKLSQKSLLVLVKSGAHKNFEIQKKDANNVGFQIASGVIFRRRN
jgi:hypothetical protein